MPKETESQILSLLWRINQVLMPLAVAFMVWLVQQQFATERRVAVLENAASTTEATHDSLRTKIMRDVETEANKQREAMQAQLATISRDLIRVMAYLEVSRVGTSYPPSKGNPRTDGGDDWVK